MGPASATPFTTGSAYRQLLGFDTWTALIKGASDTTNQALSADTTLNQTDPPILTTFPVTGIGNQLKQVAKLIQIGNKAAATADSACTGQIFFCSLGILIRTRMRPRPIRLCRTALEAGKSADAIQ